MCFSDLLVLITFNPSTVGILLNTYQTPPSILTCFESFILPASSSFSIFHTSALFSNWSLIPPWSASKPDYPTCLLCLHRTQEKLSTPLELFSIATLNQQEPRMAVLGPWTNWQKLKSLTPSWSKQSLPTALSWILLMRNPAWCPSPYWGLLLRGVSTAWSSEVCPKGFSHLEEHAIFTVPRQVIQMPQISRYLCSVIC